MNFKIMLASFALIFVAELGDKTQLAALAFTTSYRSPWMVFIGTSLALITTSALAVLLGEALNRVLPVKVLHISSGVLFVLMGVILLVNVARKAEVTPVPAPTAPPRTEAEPRSAVFAFVTSQATAFEEEIIARLEKIMEALPASTMRDTLATIIAEDRQHMLSISALRDTQMPILEQDGDQVSGSDLLRLQQCAPAAERVQQGATEREAGTPAVQTGNQAIQQAVESEEALAEFYLALARMAKLHPVRDAFRWLAMEDIRHAQTLCSLINPDEPLTTDKPA
jgi:rubrerythrin